MKKSKWRLAASVFQLLIGIAAVIAFVIMLLNGESIVKWIGTLLCAIGIGTLGISGIADYISGR